jgi:single-strand DNA-binding protein
MNKITVTGNLKAAPRESILPSGTPASNFDIASDRTWTDPNGVQQKHTTWYRIEVLNGQAGPCNQYLSKGRKVLIEGHLVTDPNGNPKIWTDKNGEPRATFTIRAHSVEFMDRPADGANTQKRETPQEAADNIPF